MLLVRELGRLGNDVQVPEVEAIGYVACACGIVSEPDAPANSMGVPTKLAVRKDDALSLRALARIRRRVRNALKQNVPLRAHG